MKVRVLKFQSLKEATIEIDKLTVITGPSNIGKSAFVRGFVAAITNRRGNDFVMKGEECADVLIEHEGHSVRWVKGEGTCEYHIDGVPNKKAGRSTPKDEIAAALGIYPVTAQGSAYYPQIQRQFDKPFIVAESSPTIAAELLAASKHNQVITTAVKLAQKDHGKKETEIELREGQLATLKARLTAADLVVPLIAPIREKASLSYAETRRLRSRIETLTHLHNRYVRTNIIIMAADLAPKNLLPNPPSASRTPVLQSLYSRWSLAHRALKASQQITLPLPVYLGNPNRLSILRDLSRRHARAQVIHKAVKELPILPDHAELVQVRGRVVSLRTLRDQYHKAVQDRDLSLKEASDLTRQAAAVETEIHNLLLQMGVCPVCDSKIEPSVPHTHLETQPS